MRKRLFTLLACGMALSLTAPTESFAGTRDPGVNKRQKHQQERINQGVKSGSLTKRETLKLERNQARIDAKEEKFKSDGELTPEERAKLQRMQNTQNRKIYREKHDNQAQN